MWFSMSMRYFAALEGFSRALLTDSQLSQKQATSGPWLWSGLFADAISSLALSAFPLASSYVLP